MKLYILIFILVVVFGIIVNWNAILINQRPTRAETIAICDSMINVKASIFHIRNAGKLESCLLTLIKIEYNKIEIYEAKRELEKHLRWLADREEQRQEAARNKFGEER